MSCLLLLGCSSPTFKEPDAGPDAGTSDASFQLPDVGTHGGDAWVPGPVLGDLTGKVFAPNGTIPISGALVYTTSSTPPAIPTTNYCDTCVTLSESTDYALSQADGSFDLKLHAVGNMNLVVQKGGFRVVRPIGLAAGSNAAPATATTLPAKLGAGDSIPSIVVLDPDYDYIQDALTKIGLAEGVGFTRYTNGWNTLLGDAKALSAYQIVFMPCSDTTATDKDPTVPTVAKNLQDFVAAGGRAYVTDWAYDYVTQVWPPYITIDGESATIGSGWQSLEDRPTTVKDPGLAAWLKAQAVTTWTAFGNWTTIDKVSKVATNGSDGGPTDVTPTVWVTAKGSLGDLPTTISFPRSCGKVLFSTYHTEGNDTTSALTPQELALLYILLEVSVCTDSSTGVVITPN